MSTEAFEDTIELSRVVHDLIGTVGKLADQVQAHWHENTATHAETLKALQRAEYDSKIKDQQITALEEEIKAHVAIIAAMGKHHNEQMADLDRRVTGVRNLTVKCLETVDRRLLDQKLAHDNLAAQVKAMASYERVER